jgi:acyl-CoA synthetase (AMP-forming)/AMP-acid ligase II
MIITVPAFLKRAVEELGRTSAGAGAGKTLGLQAPWIFTSGGVLPPEIAEKTNRVFGFWPVEVYGSTETSGIAWRQSKDGLPWTPFDNTRISKNDEGCLVVRSPYIKESAGFITGDLVDILDDGRFLLRGRSDSIVKIEEKRISLPEVENRLLQSGLAADVCVIALEDRRQYLAAALVLNKAGKAQFKSAEKFEMNRYFREYLLQFFENVVLPKKWRYPEALPVDAQGKKKKQEIRKLFQASAAAENIHSITAKVLEKNDSLVKLELFIPEESDYFDGHFPEFKLLPAVAQIELVIRLGSRHFGTPVCAAKIKRIKFSNIIHPGSPVHLEIQENASGPSLVFKMTSPQDNIVYSSGTLTVGDAQ